MKQFKSSLGAMVIALLVSSCGSDSSSNVHPAGGIGGGIYQGGCVPLSAPIGFVGTNNYYSGPRVAGGELPLSAVSPPLYPTGQVVLGGGGGGPYGKTRIGDPGTSISMNIIPMSQGGGYGGGYPGYYGQYQANTTGVLTLSQTVQSAIAGSYGYYGGGFPYPQPGYPTYQQPGYNQGYGNFCISKVAFDLGVGGGTLFGDVYIYLNGPNGQLIDAPSIYF